MDSKVKKFLVFNREGDNLELPTFPCHCAQVGVRRRGVSATRWGHGRARHPLTLPWAKPSLVLSLIYLPMKLRIPFRALSAFLTSCLVVGAAMANRPWTDPTASWETLGPPRGTLLIVGGAAVDSIYRDFLDLVGDRSATIVLIPTASAVGTEEDSNAAYKKLVELGATDVVILHTTDPAVADTEDFVEPLRRARAVYISGGQQRRLAEAYLHTRTHTELFKVLERGGVVAGSSAGASIQGSYLYGGGNEQRVGFGFIKDSAIGQHYVRRSRVGGVGRVLRQNLELFGIGIDEATGIVVRGNDFEVIGDSKVAVYDPRLPGWPEGREQDFLFAGDRYDMRERLVTHRAQPKPTDLWDDADREWVSPADSWTTGGPPKGRLLLMASGVDDALKQQFVAELGDPAAAIVVLSTGSEEERFNNESLANDLRRLGARNVSVLHTIDRDQANSEAFVQPLRAARAVWVGDVPMWKLADSYVHTLVNRELFGVLERGGLIAGEGSGANLLSSSLVSAGYRWTTGFGLVRDAVITEHPLAGSRPQRALREALEKQSALLAIGLGQAAAVRIEGDQMSVVGTGPVAIQDGSATGRTRPRLLSQGNAFDLKQRR